MSARDAGADTGAIDAADAAADARAQEDAAPEGPDDAAALDAAPAPNVCAADAPACEPPPGTPVYSGPGMFDGTSTFHLAMMGGEGWLNSQSAVFDGYSAVLTWPAQAAAGAPSPNVVSAWPGIYLENGYFIQNGYFAGTQPCLGGIWVEIFDPYQLQYAPGVAGSFCDPGQKVQFRAERDGTEWVFSMRVVGGGDFVEQGRYDFGGAFGGQFPVYAVTEMHDYDESIELLEPITFGPILLKQDGVWRPIDYLATVTLPDGSSPRLPIRPEPRLAGVTTSAPGPICNGPGVELWTAAAPCWATDVHCDATTSACDP